MLAVASGNVHAHLVSSGLGPFFDGVGHFFLSVETLLPVLALLLLSGSAGLTVARRSLFLLPPVWLCGLALGWMLPSSEIPLGWVAPLMLLLAGTAVALQRTTFALPALVLGGLLLGFAEGSGLGALAPPPSLLLGTACSLFVISSLVPASTLTLIDGAAWRLFVVRVLGSWLAAIGLLMLGWLLAAPAA
jgi:hypothetical protein